jgi:LacI family transcriptional regulator
MGWVSMTERPSPTIRDVARLAGTSTAVVSYVLNAGPRPVSAATRERVLHAVEQLGYRRNRMARALRARRSGVVGLIVPDPANPYFAQLGRAIESAAYERGQQLVLAAGGAGDRESTALRAFLELQVDGLLVVPAGQPEPLLNLLSDTDLPSVVLHRRVRHADLRAITNDDRAAGYAAASHLLEHGHRYVACVSGPKEPGSPVVDRTTGYRAALRNAGHRASPADVVDCPYGAAIDVRFEVARALLVNRPRVSAVVACTDESAFALLRAAADLGRRVPDDLAVVTIDGTQGCEASVPSLSAVTTDFTAIAESALESILGAAGVGEQQVDVPMTLERRESCGCTARRTSSRMRTEGIGQVDGR